MADFLFGKRLTLTTWPWGATGLHYNGSRSFSAFSKDRQAALATFARRAVDFYTRRTSGHSTRPITAIQFVRSLINGTYYTFHASGSFRPFSTEESKTFDELKADGLKFADMLTIPSRQRLAFVDWRDKSDWDKASDYLGSPTARPAWIAAGLALLLAGGLAAAAVLPAARPVVPVIGGVLLAIVAAVGMLLLTAAVAAFLFVRKLRRLESADRPDERDPDLDTLRAIAERENAPGCHQNHITAVSDTKTGWFHRLTLSMALWGIGVLVRYRFRPGFIDTIGTIHFTSWVRLPNSGKLLFISNYDGSWDSYLEDFITKVPIGQTAAWTHATGFPRTRNLTGEGVRDGDRFKRWVRRQQRATDFWYIRRPALTLDRMRTNALVHDGLARASSDTAARQWLCNFGSTQPTDALLETDEIQTIVFRGLPGRPHSAVLLLELPAAQNNRSAFIAGLLNDSGDKDVPRITFGEMPPGGSNHDSVAYLAFSARGLEHCGIPVVRKPEETPGFPFPLVEGMRSRKRITGDLDDPPADAWDDRSFGEGTVHAVLKLLALEPGLRDASVSAVTRLLAGRGGRVLDCIATDPPDRAWRLRDHFGFRDGISQPAIRGSFGGRRALDRDRMAPGEFIFGYRGNQGYVAPSPRVPVASDPARYAA